MKKLQENIRKIRKPNMEMWEAAVQKVLQLLYPPRCPFCDEILDVSERELLCCSICSRKIPWVTGARCMKCGKPVSSCELEYCPDCQKTKHAYDRGAAVFRYSGCMPGSIYRLKAVNRRDYIGFFAEALYRSSRMYLKRWQPQVIIPVPMHPHKKAARGYNQSELLAKAFSKKTGIPYADDLLFCVKKTKVQKLLGQKDRKRNLRGSFAAKKSLRDLHTVLVIDDVYTTGSTMDEIAYTLKKAGVRYVYFFVLCTGNGKNSVSMSRKM